MPKRSYPLRNKPFAAGGKHIPIQRQQSSGGYIRFFTHFGVSISGRNHQQDVATCPFIDCQKEDHFFINPATGQWDCKRCGKNGNTYSFLSMFHQSCMDNTTEEDYHELAKLRSGIPVSVFKEWKLALSYITKEWLLPAFSQESKLINLYAWRKFYKETLEDYEWTIHSSPTLRQVPYGLHLLGKERTKPLYILEGHWDTLAFYGMASSLQKSGNRLIDSLDLIGVPGAGSFPKDYLHLLEARDIRILFDNDMAGNEGINNIVKALAQNSIIPMKIGALNWPKEMADKVGYDVRDLIISGNPL